MSEVTVIGLGLMGPALAEALLKKPLTVGVRNRNESRGERLKGAGRGGGADGRGGHRSE